MSAPPRKRRNLWTDEQLRLAFYLYCQTPFGRMHSRNPDIIKLAELIGRTPSALAMKLVNFASLDPSITETGRSGLANASEADRKVWQEFHENWGDLAEESSRAIAAGIPASAKSNLSVGFAEPETADFVGEVRQATVSVRIRQGFFRRSILASYGGKCCMSGVSSDQLIVASHIVPWATDEKNRLNPRNGLCLSAIHDKAFDSGLITVTPQMKIEVCDDLKRRKAEGEVSAAIAGLHGKPINLPARFHPDQAFLRWHNENRFVGR